MGNSRYIFFIILALSINSCTKIENLKFNFISFSSHFASGFVSENSKEKVRDENVEPDFKVDVYLDSHALFIHEADMYSRALWISKNEFDSVSCSKDNGFNFDDCDLDGRALLWEQKHYENGQTMVIRFTQKTGLVEDYEFNPSEFNPNLKFLACDNITAVDSRFSALNKKLVSIEDFNEDGIKVLCLDGGTHFTSSDDSESFLFNKDVYLVGTHFNSPIFSKGIKDKKSPAIIIKGKNSATLANISVSTKEKSQHGIKFSLFSSLNLNNINIKTEGQDSFGVYSNGGFSNMNNLNVLTKGNDSDGLHIDKFSFTNAERVKIDTFGENSPGVSIYNNSMPIFNSTLIKTHSSSAHSNGVFVDNGSFQFNNSIIESTGLNTTAIQVDRGDIFGIQILLNSSVIAQTRTGLSAISQAEGGNLSLKNTEVSNSGNGLELRDGLQQLTVNLSEVIFKLAIDAEEGPKHLAVKKPNSKNIIVYSPNDNNIACHKGEAIYSNGNLDLSLGEQKLCR